MNAEELKLAKTKAELDIKDIIDDLINKCHGHISELRVSVDAVKSHPIQHPKPSVIFADVCIRLDF